MLGKAIHIAARAHEVQTDKGGQPYILHPLRVMNSVEGENEKICAVLHDVIEDTDITLEYLKREGFSDEVCEALDSLTKHKDEDYEDFISRVLLNRTACIVKLADLADNMDMSRITNPGDDDFARQLKYEKAKKRILQYFL
jgi:(p)ppGpp synthase/HD superfamily hydrolase